MPLRFSVANLLWITTLVAALLAVVVSLPRALLFLGLVLALGGGGCLVAFVVAYGIAWMVLGVLKLVVFGGGESLFGPGANLDREIRPAIRGLVLIVGFASATASSWYAIAHHSRFDPITVIMLHLVGLLFVFGAVGLVESGRCHAGSGEDR